MVIYNGSGKYVKAVATTAHVVSHQCYYRLCATAAEAHYLAGWLNATEMQNDYRNARDTDRDFMTHIWAKVPIPRFEAANTDHQKLAQLAKVLQGQCEAMMDSGTGWRTLDRRIRATLESNRTMEKINSICRQLMKPSANPAWATEPEPNKEGGTHG